MPEFFFWVVLLFPSVLALPTLIGNYALGAIIIGVFRLFSLFLVYAIWTIIAFNTRSDPIMVMGVGEIVVCLADILGRTLPLMLLATNALEAVLAPLAIMAIVGFSVVSAVLVPKRYLDQIISICDAQEKTQEETRKSGSWRDRCEAVSAQYGLSAREKDVFILLVHNHDSSYISKKLVVSYYTVRAHTRNIYTKTGVHSRQELINLVEDAN